MGRSITRKRWARRKVALCTAVLTVGAVLSVATPAQAVAAGLITTYAGGTTPTPGVNGGDGGPATAATMDAPSGVAVDPFGNLFIADSENRVVRKVDLQGKISTYVGNGQAGFSGDGGPAASALINSPFGLAEDAAGDLFIADNGNFRIRKVTEAGVISTVAGTGAAPTSSNLGEGGPAAAAAVAPYGLTSDSAGNLYFTDDYNDAVREVTTSGIIKTVAGNGVYGFSGDGGPATSAQLSYPGGVLIDGSGDLYLSDQSRVREVLPNGTITTIAGNGMAGSTGDGGPATSAELNQTYGLAKDSSGNLYISDFPSSRVRMINSSGIISTVAGNGTHGDSGDGGPATSAELQGNFNLALNPNNTVLYISENANVRAVGLGSTSPPPPPPPPTSVLDAGTFIAVAYNGNTTGGYDCTTGFAAQNQNLVNFELGAKHCLDGDTGDQKDNSKVAKFSPQQITFYAPVQNKRGPVLALGLPCVKPNGSATCLLPKKSNNIGDFFAWRPDTFIPDGYVQTALPTPLPVLGGIVPNAGDTVCHFGAGSAKGGQAEHCGIILTSKQMTKFCQKKAVSGDCESGAVSLAMYGAGGDSGGPVYEYNSDKSGVYAVGLEVLADANGSAFVPIGTVLSRLGLTLTTP